MSLVNPVAENPKRMTSELTPEGGLAFLAFR